MTKSEYKNGKKVIFSLGLQTEALLRPTTDMIAGLYTPMLHNKRFGTFLEIQRQLLHKFSIWVNSGSIVTNGDLVAVTLTIQFINTMTEINSKCEQFPL